MSGTYLLGVFNDSFYKEAAILLAFAAGMSELQSPIIKYFSLPFILFSGVAGYLADRFAKRNVVIASKYMELAAMGLGAMGILTGSFPLVLAMVFTMALQSTLFSPALNGSIPESFHETEVPRVNALLKMITTVSIIVGIVLAGIVLDLHLPALKLNGKALTAAVIIAVSLIGVVSAHRLIRVAPHSPTQKPSFLWIGPLQSVRDTISLRSSPRLLKALLLSTFFYFTSTLVLAAVHELSLTDLGFSSSFTSALSGIIAIGVAAGSIFSIRLSKRFSFEQIFFPAAVLFGTALIIASLSALHPIGSTELHLATALFVTGAAGGAFLIPLLTYIQVTPVATEKGKILGINNFLDFLGIFIAGELFGRLHPRIEASTLLAGTGAFSLATAALFIIPKKENSHV